MKDVPLLLIHGYPFDHTMWFSTIASLGSKAKVLLPDLPGFGRTDLPTEKRPAMEHYAAFLLELIENNQHQKVVVAGMSMGGYVALAFAEKYPDRVSGLGLISTQAAADTAEARQARQEMIKKIGERGITAATEAIIPKMFSGDKATNPDLRKYPELGAEQAGPNGLIWALDAMAQRPDRRPVLAALTCPVLVVHGTEDKIIPIAIGRATAEICQKPIFVEASGAGHATPLEAPDQVAVGLSRLMQACKEESAMV